ncbi:polyribonucleotide nucleotidyltransferase, partial [Reticulomyxa filosa]
MHMSGVPWDGPIGAVRIGYCDNALLVNPSDTELRNSSLNLLYVGNAENTVMIETDGKEVPDETYCEALRLAQKSIKPLIDAQQMLYKEHCKSFTQFGLQMPSYTKFEKEMKEVEAIQNSIRSSTLVNSIQSTFQSIYTNYELTKASRGKMAEEARKNGITSINEYLTTISESNPLIKTLLEDEKMAWVVNELVYDIEKETFRNLLFFGDQRCDGRKFDQIRPLSCHVDVLPSSHGSSLFRRGNTQ